MDWIKYNSEESIQAFEKFCDTGEIECDKSYDSLRQDLCMLFSDALEKIGITEDQLTKKNNSYQLDLYFGIKLYTTLNEKYGMNVRLASTDGIWRYLSTNF